MLEEFNVIAQRVAEKLRAREEKIAVADGATGGLIAASLLTVPGALSFYLGGGIVYSQRARDVLYALDPGEYANMRSATEEYALVQAKGIRDNFGAEWGIAESGAAGSSKHPSGIASGRSCCAVVGPGGIEVTQLTETQSDHRIGNMQEFTRRSLELLDQTLAKHA